jgi:hypothetical protein
MIILKCILKIELKELNCIIYTNTVQGFGGPASDAKSNIIFLKMATLATIGKHSEQEAQPASCVTRT